MLDDVQNLLQLQDADQEIARLNAEVSALPKRVAAIEQKLAGTKARVEAAQAAIHADEAARTKLDQQIQDARTKISKYRDQSLAVKNNEQYKALMSEIEHAEKEIAGCEEKILEVMESAEAKAAALKAVQAELALETEAVAKEKQHAEATTAKDAKLLGSVQSKRAGLRTTVTEEWLTKYERVMKFRGSGLAAVRDGQCTACRVRLRPQVFAEVKAESKMMACDSCQRIIYYDPANDTPLEQLKAAAAAKQKKRSKAQSDRTWVYRVLPDTEEEIFVALFSDASNTRRRVYDAATGRKLGSTERREGDFKTGCMDDLDPGIRLHVAFTEELLESWGGELPTSYMMDLRKDLAAAQGK